MKGEIMSTYLNKRHYSWLQRLIAMCVCLVMAAAMVPVPAQAEQTEEPSYELSEAEAQALAEAAFGSGLTPVEGDPDSFTYAMSPAQADRLAQMVAVEDRADSTNDLPADYTDDSNTELKEYLDFAKEIAPMAAVDHSDKKVDLFFIIDSTGSMHGQIRNVKNNVAEFARYLATQGVTLRLGLIDYKDITDDGMDSTVIHRVEHSPWMNVDQFIMELTEVSVEGGGDTPETPIDALGYLTKPETGWSSDAYKFAMVVTDADYKNNNRHGIANMDEMALKLREMDIQTSVITGHYEAEAYRNLVLSTGGVSANMYENFGQILKEYADTVIGTSTAKKNYAVMVQSQNPCVPVAGAQLQWAGGSAVTDAGGLARITIRGSEVRNLTVTASGYQIYKADQIMMTENASHLIRLVPTPGSGTPGNIHPSQFDDGGKVGDTIHGPVVTMFKKAFELFTLEANFRLGIFSDISIKHNPDEKSVEVIIGRAWEGKDPNDTDPYWKEDYKKYKSLVQTFSKKKPMEIYNEFRTLRKNNKSEAHMMYPVDISVAGYAEFSYASGDQSLMDGGVVISISSKDIPIAEWPFPPAPYIFVNMKFKIDGKGRFGLVQIDREGAVKFSPSLENLSVEPGFSLGVNAGVPRLAYVGGGGTLSTEAEFSGLPPKPLREILSLKGKLGFYVELKVFGFSGSADTDIGQLELYPNFGEITGPTLLSLDEEDFVPIPRRAYPMTMAASSMGTDLTLQRPAYEDSAPQLIALQDGRWMLLWTDSVAGRAETEHMALHYALYSEKEGWTEPKMVCDDQTGDFRASAMLLSDGKLAVAWQNSKPAATVALAAQTDLATRLQQIELSVSIFDPVTNAFEPATTVAPSAGKAPLCLQVISTPEGPEVYWLENSDNNPMLNSGTTDIVRALPDGTTSAVETGIQNLFAFAVGRICDVTKVLYMTTGETRDVLHTPDCTYSISKGGHSLQFCQDGFFWGDEKGLHSWNGGISNFNIPTPNQFLVASNGYKKVLLSHYSIGDAANPTEILEGRLYNGDHWGVAREIARYEGRTADIASLHLLGDGTVLWTANRCGADHMAQMSVESHKPEGHLVISPEGYISGANVMPAGETTMFVELSNDGLLDVSSLQARLPDGTTTSLYMLNQYGRRVSFNSIYGGERIAAEIPVKLPADLSTRQTYTVEILQESQVMGQVSAELIPAADLVMKNVHTVRNEDNSVTVVGTLINCGAGLAEAPSVSLRIENAEAPVSELNSTVLPDMKPGDSQSVSFTVAKEQLNAASPYDYKRLIFSAVTASNEWLTSDNTASALVAPIAAQDLQLDTEAVVLDSEQTHAIGCTLLPAGSVGSVSYLSSNVNVASVSEDGLITAIRPGTAEITVLEQQSGKFRTITVTVTGEISVGVSGVHVTPNEAELAIGESVTLQAQVFPSNATNPGLSWYTEDTGVVSLSSDGAKAVVTAKNPGSARISVVTEDGSYSHTAVILVRDPESHEHAFGSWIELEEPTSFREGRKYRICAICGEAEYLTLPVLSNPFTDIDPDGFYFEPVLWAVYRGITKGTTETTFEPEAICTRAQVATFLWRAAGQPAPQNSTNPFTDVPANEYYYDAVLWAVEQGITVGTSKTTYSPEQGCTRAQVATFLWRAAGQPAPQNSTNPFTDVPANEYYYDAVLWAVEQGITVGTSKTTFSPEDTCTRSQIVTFLYRSVH